MPSNYMLSAYQSALSGRALEACVLRKAAGKLQDCVDHWGDAEHSSRLDEALHFTQQLWTLFQADWMVSDDRLPEEIRQNLLDLSRIVDRHIFGAMANPSPEHLMTIIGIHSDLAAGLSTRSEAGSAVAIDSQG